MASRTDFRFRVLDWNEIIDEANSRAAGCESTLPPLDLVTAPHKWSVSDITDARDRADAICKNAPAFAAPLVKWTRVPWAELHDALAILELRLWLHNPVMPIMVASLDGGYSYSRTYRRQWDAWYTQVSDDPIEYQWHILAHNNFSVQWPDVRIPDRQWRQP